MGFFLLIDVYFAEDLVCFHDKKCLPYFPRIYVTERVLKITIWRLKTETSSREKTRESPFYRGFPEIGSLDCDWLNSKGAFWVSHVRNNDVWRVIFSQSETPNQARVSKKSGVFTEKKQSGAAFFELFIIYLWACYSENETGWAHKNTPERRSEAFTEQVPRQEKVIPSYL